VGKILVGAPERSSDSPDGINILSRYLDFNTDKAFSLSPPAVALHSFFGAFSHTGNITGNTLKGQVIVLRKRCNVERPIPSERAARVSFSMGGEPYQTGESR
jgi:hypothetical protein